MVEFGIIVALIVLVGLIGTRAFGGKIKDQYCRLDYQTALPGTDSAFSVQMSNEFSEVCGDPYDFYGNGGCDGNLLNPACYGG